MDIKGKMSADMSNTTKPFFEVFPTLKIDGPLHDKLEQTAVERVSSPKRRDALHVYRPSIRRKI